MHFYYSTFRAVKNVNLAIAPQKITALIGPSGCGKSTVLRCFNRMNDLVPGTRLEGQVLFHGKNLYAPDVDAVEVRRRIGMVFQKPNPFPKSIYENIAFGPRINGWRGSKTGYGRAGRALAARRSAVGRCQGQAPAVRHGALGRAAAAPVHRPRAGGRAGDHSDGRAVLGARPDLDDQDRGADVRAAARDYTIVIVTHNMQQAARASDYTAFFLMDTEDRAGQLVEFGPTEKLFTNPKDKRTEEYITGRFG